MQRRVAKKNNRMAKNWEAQKPIRHLSVKGGRGRILLAKEKGKRPKSTAEK